MPTLIFRIPPNRWWPIAGLLALFALTAAPAAHARDDDLVKYATQCRAKIPIDVPNFNCLTGVVIPMVGTEGHYKKGGKCDNPPYLPGSGCFRYSRIGDLGSTDKVGLVFLCRHKEPASEDENFNWQDIAVIQTNFDTGATCFYQQLQDDSGPGLSGLVQSPAAGEGPWITPKEMALEKHACVQCHDNGPLVRTPYLMQVKNHVKIFEEFEKRNEDPVKRAKYWFPGAEFLFYDPPTNSKNWNGNVLRVSELSVAKPCTECHEMGVQNIDKAVGTSTWLGPLATGVVATPLMRNGAGFEGDLAYWMRPSLTQPSLVSKTSAEKYRDCAKQAVGTPPCVHQLFEGEVLALTELAQQLLQEKTAASPASQQPKRTSPPSQWRDSLKHDAHPGTD